jgi:amino acid adenylation domain-containing protein
VANVLYTSGSTGTPKGVMITAQSLLHFSHWAVDTFAITHEDRLSNHAPFHFDVSTLDIFAGVRAAAAVCPVPESQLSFPYPLAQWIADRRITIWYSVPSALLMMTLRGGLDDHDWSLLRRVLFAGEVMPPETVRALMHKLPEAELWNLFGPTETNVCTAHRVSADDVRDDRPVPVGRPIRDTVGYVVDEAGQGVDKGQTGELWVAGPTLLAGYLGDRKLTAERMVPAPDGSGQTCYRTGDRVRDRGDGVLLFLGRADRMVKSRGYRIELGDVESAIARHPAVGEVAVVPVPDPVFGYTLRAVLSPRPQHTVSPDQLDAFVRRSLPGYMVPEAWDIRPALPRTDRGKIDHQRLARERPPAQ